MRIVLLTALTAATFLSCSPEKKIRKAFNNGQYQRVIDYYANILERDPANGKANFFIAESFRLSNRLREAENFYSKARGGGIDQDSVLYFYAQALRANGKYSDATQTLERLRSQGRSEEMKKLAQRQLDGIASLERISSRTNYYKIKSLEALNTVYAEFSPVYLNGELYFTSSRIVASDKNSSAVYEASGTPYTDLFKVATKGAIVSPETVTRLAPVINDELRNEGCITFSPDGKTMVFGRGNSKKKKGGGVDVDLYLSRFRNGIWSEPVLINVNTQFKDENSAEAQNFSWDSTPFFSPDGRTLYFASNRKGGFGGTDLYAAQVDSRGRFGRIRNMGPDINTPGDELFPYMAENGKFYFASDGHPGFGMLDLFVVNRAEGRTIVENLGQPMNSTSDDFGIYLFQPDRGFFTSNREGGKGDDDIYTFRNEDPNLKVVNYTLRGQVFTYKKDSTLDVVPEARVSLLDGKGEMMQDFETSVDGKFNFRVYENESYTLVGEGDGFLTERLSWSMKGKSAKPEDLKELVTNIAFDTVIVLPKKLKDVAYRLERIYFGFDSANIRPASAAELNKLVQVLVDNPDIKIELSAHTDSVGTFEKNMRLSERRAQATVDYLITKGIARERLVAKGYGETRPIARNTNPDGTDNPEGRQRNRRTEFRILEIGMAPVRKPEEELDDEDRFFRKNN
ncbi:MAG: OmpA family protein [Bacteroidetes bacterium]|nr:OmpA family protein [Bacteroidota bacterium]